MAECDRNQPILEISPAIRQNKFTVLSISRALQGLSRQSLSFRFGLMRVRRTTKHENRVRRAVRRGRVILWYKHL